jgi:hypothetical protein
MADAAFSVVPRFFAFFFVLRDRGFATASEASVVLSVSASALPSASEEPSVSAPVRKTEAESAFTSVETQADSESLCDSASVSWNALPSVSGSTSESFSLGVSVSAFDSESFPGESSSTSTSASLSAPVEQGEASGESSADEDIWAESWGFEKLRPYQTQNT